MSFKARCYKKDTARLMIPLGKLFQATNIEPHLDQLKFIHGSRTHPWPPHNVTLPSKYDVFLSIVKEILIPICRLDEIILEKKYAKFYHSTSPASIGLKVQDTGIGSPDTWHGSPDARVRGSPFVFKKGSEDEKEIGSGESNSDSEGETSDGTSVLVEAKLLMTGTNLPQAIATCVVSSFTEKKLHPNLPAAIPTILIDANKFQVCLYDSEKDVLLVSEPMMLATKGGLSQSAMTVLWLTVNHR